ncbi:FUSC family protein [Brachybacterium endophyticum]|uniref:FUSC family protein n=1 Tax=Brachybacterium endophyticum TaxID=2182385 RepID=A0A2U2RL67_9MICO|nr:FUSC family protein [Brachybacterium endophyticum]PWH06524.1 FUSC family protein [Brachybacterium endophyticum]
MNPRDSTEPASTTTGVMTAVKPPLVERVRTAVTGHLGAGLDRDRKGLGSIARAGVATCVAYLIAHFIWGHPFPFFAAIAAFVIIGVSSTEKKVRKVLEMAAGVMCGVLLGELARATIGSGFWQIAVVVVTAGLLARLIDSGIVFTMQMSIQSLLVTVMPLTPSMSPGTRIVDALTGVVVAIVVHLLTSGDPRRAQKQAAHSLYRALEDALTQMSLAARSGDVRVATAALSQIRTSSQELVDEWKVANNAAEEISTYSPTHLRHAGDVERLRHLLVGSDRAVRNVRVIARREVEFLDVVKGRSNHSRLADAFLAANDAARALRRAIDSGADFTEARRALRMFCSYLTPDTLLRSDNGERLGRVDHFEGVALVIQLRSLAIDLLEATGLEHKDAQRFLPSLLIAADGDTIGPRPLTREMSAVEPPATTEALELLITDRSDPGRRRP